MKKALYIGIPMVLLFVAALFTVLNKRWWARRIFQKWDIASDMSSNEELLKNTPLMRMVDIYRKGMDGWQLRGTKSTTTATVEDPDAG